MTASCQKELRSVKKGKKRSAFWGGLHNRGWPTDSQIRGEKKLLRFHTSGLQFGHHFALKSGIYCGLWVRDTGREIKPLRQTRGSIEDECRILSIFILTQSVQVSKHETKLPSLVRSRGDFGHVAEECGTYYLSDMSKSLVGPIQYASQQAQLLRQKWLEESSN